MLTLAHMHFSEIKTKHGKNKMWLCVVWPISLLHLLRLIPLVHVVRKLITVLRVSWHLFVWLRTFADHIDCPECWWHWGLYIVCSNKNKKLISFTGIPIFRKRQILQIFFSAETRFSRLRLSFELPHEKTYSVAWQLRKTKISLMGLVILKGCSGWSMFSLVRELFRQVFSWCHSFVLFTGAALHFD